MLVEGLDAICKYISYANYRGKFSWNYLEFPIIQMVIMGLLM